MQRLYLHALVAELLATLETDGQPFGTGEHLRIGELLQNLPENTAPEQLKTLIAPILCSTKEEQERFYQIFDRSWKQVEAVGVAEVETGEHPIFSQVETRITPWALLTVILVLIGLWGIGNWAGSASQKGIPIAFHAFSATVGDPEKSLQIDSLVEHSQTHDGRKFSVDPLSKFSAKNEGGNAGIRLDTQSNRVYYSGLQEGSDTVWLRAHPHGWHHTQVWKHQIVFSVSPPPDTSKKEDAPLDTALYVQRPIPHPRDLTQLEAPQPTALQQFLLDWEWPLKVAAILLVGLLVWFAARLWERNRRKLIAEHRPNQKPPYAWSIQLKNPPRVDLGERFHRLLSQLRRREGDENWLLDVPRTLRATIAKGGVPQFRYAQQTRPSEYLLLIDRHSPRNHQAQLFDLIARAFRNQEVLLERFWYDGDPRLCWNEAYPAGLDPRALHYHYPQSRVILFGDAEQLLNQETGRLSKWATQTFSAWQDRAILSPKPLNAWGRRERSLQELFHVLPASLSAIEVAIERFETDVEKDADLDPRRFPDAAQVPIQLIDNDLIKTLEHYFGNDQFTRRSLGEGGSPVNQSTALPAVALAKGGHQTTNLPIWIAACAVYPELHWDMTLYLGDLLSDSNSPLLTADNIAQICRMPWFSEGEIPLEARKTLLAWLESEHPDTLHQIREGIHRLLAQNPPPEDSAAHDAYAMNMALNEWLYTKDSARKKELEKDILRRIAAGQAADFMVLKILEGPRSPEEFEVPENWRKLLKQKGLARTTRKSWVWAVPLWVLLCVGVVGWKPEEVGCKGVVLTTQGKEWCAETLEEVLEVWEMQALNTIENPNTVDWENLVDATVQDILQNGRVFQWLNQTAKDWQDKPIVGSRRDALGRIDSISFFQNLAVGFFNQGVILRNATLPSDSIGCYYFLRAQELNVLLPDTAQLWYVREAAARCESPSLHHGLYLQGRLLDATTNQPVAAMLQSKVEAQGLQPGIVTKGGYFSLELPDDWNSPVQLKVTVPGYDPYSKTVYAKSFDKTIIIRLLKPQPLGEGGGEECYVHYRNLGLAAMQRADYIEAIIYFQAAIVTCQDMPQNTDLNVLIAAAQDSIISAKQRVTDRADRDGDGVSDPEDKCPDEKGTSDNGGCPNSDLSASDRDGDGVPDSIDSCPDVKGTIYGCPPGTLFKEHQVTQGETLRSIAAKYKLEIGALAQANGLEVRESLKVGKVLLIPVDKETDRDDDGVPDKEDKCPDKKGWMDNEGCPYNQEYREKLLGFWFLEAVELGEAVKILIEYRNDGYGTYQFYNRLNRLVETQNNRKWEIQGGLIKSYKTDGTDLAISSIEKLDNQNFELKIVDNGNTNYKGLTRKYRRIQPTDNDGDGVLDVVDNCPEERGENSNAGCSTIIPEVLNYVNKYKTIAIQDMDRSGIPASISLAQGILESAYGRSELAQKANNHFGIKCGDKWSGKTYKKIDDKLDQKGNLLEYCFRKYKTVEESYYDHGEYLRDPTRSTRYGFLFNLDRTDYKGWARGLQSAGYATAPDYADKLINLIERYKLYEFDK